MIQYVITSAALAYCTYTDIRYRRIEKRALWIYLAAVCGGCLLCGEFRMEERAEGMIPGIVCLAFSGISRQALGYGDSFLILLCGFSLGLEVCISVLLTAFFWSGIWAVFQLGRGRTEKGEQLPFAPCLLVGTVLQWLGNMWIS